MRSEMENISEKITEEGGQFRMLTPNTVTWTPFLLIYIVIKFHSISFYKYDLVYGEDCPLEALKIL